MFLFNPKTGVKICLAKYYPSTGWVSEDGLSEHLNEAFDKSDFGYLTEEQKTEKNLQPGFGPPYANYDPTHLRLGDKWKLVYLENTDP